LGFTAGESADAAVSGSNADPDHDGVINALEYAFNLNPKASDVTGLPAASMVTVGGQGCLAITYTRWKVADDLYCLKTRSPILPRSRVTTGFICAFAMLFH
jgi:hypothetical protein